MAHGGSHPTFRELLEQAQGGGDAPPESNQQDTQLTSAERQVAVSLGIDPASLEAFRLPVTALGEGGNIDWNAVLRTLDATQQTPERQPRTMEELIVRAIAEHGPDSPQVEALDDFRRRPGSGEALQQALNFATSPADLFTLSAFARGVGPTPPPSPGEGVRSLPRPPLVQQLFENFAQDALGQQDPQPTEQPVVPSQRQPARASREFAEGPNALGQFDIPPARRQTQPSQSPQIQRSLQQAAGDFADPGEVVTVPVPQRARASSIPKPSEFGGTGRELTREEVSGLTDQQKQFLEDAGFGIPAPSSRLIPENVPTGTIQFNGEDRPIPIGLDPLFQGEALERPGTLLGQVGLPRPSAQALNRMTSGERAAFVRLAEEAGIPRPDLERELRAGIPAPSKRRRTTTAAQRV